MEEDGFGRVTWVARLSDVFVVEISNLPRADEDTPARIHRATTANKLSTQRRKQ